MLKRKIIQSNNTEQHPTRLLRSLSENDGRDFGKSLFLMSARGQISDSSQEGAILAYLAEYYREHL